MIWFSIQRRHVNTDGNNTLTVSADTVRLLLLSMNTPIMSSSSINKCGTPGALDGAVSRSFLPFLNVHDLSNQNSSCDWTPPPRNTVQVSLMASSPFAHCGASHSSQACVPCVDHSYSQTSVVRRKHTHMHESTSLVYLGGGGGAMRRSMSSQ